MQDEYGAGVGHCRSIAGGPVDVGGRKVAVSWKTEQ